MKVLVLDVPDDLIAKLLASSSPAAEAPVADAPSKPPTQGVTAGMGEQSEVMQPRAPSPNALRLIRMAGHPWFQEYAAFRAAAEDVAAAGGDSLKLAQRYLGVEVLRGGSFTNWSPENDDAFGVVLEGYLAWVKSKGLDIEQA